MNYYYIKELHKPRYSQKAKQYKKAERFIQIDLQNLNGPEMCVTYIDEGMKNWYDWEPFMAEHLNGEGVIVKGLKEKLNKKTGLNVVTKDKLKIINADGVELELLAEPSLIEDCIEEYYGGKNTFSKFYGFEHNRLQ